MNLEIEKMNKFIDWLCEKLIFTKIIKKFQSHKRKVPKQILFCNPALTAQDEF